MLVISLYYLTEMGRRNEIASCEEAAYNSLPIKDAATLLFFRNPQELLSYAQQVCIRLSQPLRSNFLQLYLARLDC